MSTFAGDWEKYRYYLDCFHGFGDGHFGRDAVVCWISWRWAGNAEFKTVIGKCGADSELPTAISPKEM